ncbi:unnamed protein product [Boreogadus saida]
MPTKISPLDPTTGGTPPTIRVAPPITALQEIREGPREYRKKKDQRKGRGTEKTTNEKEEKEKEKEKKKGRKQEKR